MSALSERTSKEGNAIISCKNLRPLQNTYLFLMMYNITLLCDVSNQESNIENYLKMITKLLCKFLYYQISSSRAFYKVKSKVKSKE